MCCSLQKRISSRALEATSPFSFLERFEERPAAVCARAEPTGRLERGERDRCSSDRSQPKRHGRAILRMGLWARGGTGVRLAVLQVFLDENSFVLERLDEMREAAPPL